MKERILVFLKAENKSSAQFAEEIGVQPSGISHILSGRNNPSLDFVLKTLEKYKYLSTEWFLFGEGPMYRESQLNTLFDDTSISKNTNASDASEAVISGSDSGFIPRDIVKNRVTVFPSPEENKSKVLKIVWFYDNNSFEEYYPGH